jgi:phosphoribosylformylglycinamidine synthase
VLAGMWHITFTAETHNFPTGIAPFPGAATGIGGRLRDGAPAAPVRGRCGAVLTGGHVIGHATGTGSLVLAGTAGAVVLPLSPTNTHV